MQRTSADRNLAAFLAFSFLVTLSSLSLSLVRFIRQSTLFCGLANKNKTQNARRRVWKGVNMYVCVCVFARFSAGQEVASSCAGHGPTPGCFSAAALGRFCFLNVFFEGSNFCFTFSSFHGINLNQQICGCFWRSRIWTDFFSFYLFALTYTQTRAHTMLFFFHTRSRSPLSPTMVVASSSRILMT